MTTIWNPDCKLALEKYAKIYTKDIRSYSRMYNHNQMLANTGKRKHADGTEQIVYDMHSRGSTAFFRSDVWGVDTTPIKQDDCPQPQTLDAIKEIEIITNSANASMMLYKNSSGEMTFIKFPHQNTSPVQAYDKLEIDAGVSIGLETYFKNKKAAAEAAEIDTIQNCKKHFMDYKGVFLVTDKAWESTTEIDVTTGISIPQKTMFNMQRYINFEYTTNPGPYKFAFATKAVSGAKTLCDVLNQSIQALHFELFRNTLAHLNLFFTNLLIVSEDTYFAHGDMHVNNILYDNRQNAFVLIDYGRSYINFEKVGKIGPKSSDPNSNPTPIISQLANDLNNVYRMLNNGNTLRFSENNVSDVYFQNNGSSALKTFPDILGGNIVFNQKAIMNDIGGLCICLFVNFPPIRKFFQNVEKKKQFYLDSNNSKFVIPGNMETFKTLIANNTVDNNISKGIIWSLIYIYTYCQHRKGIRIYHDYYILSVEEVIGKQSVLMHTAGQYHPQMFKLLKPFFIANLIALLGNGMAIPLIGGIQNGGTLIPNILDTSSIKEIKEIKDIKGIEDTIQNYKQNFENNIEYSIKNAKPCVSFEKAWDTFGDVLMSDEHITMINTIIGM